MDTREIQTEIKDSWKLTKWKHNKSDFIRHIKQWWRGEIYSVKGIINEGWKINELNSKLGKLEKEQKVNQTKAQEAKK